MYDGIATIAVDAVRRRAEVARRGVEDVGHERLRVAVVHREPGALHLDHDPVTLPEGVALLVQVDDVLVDRVRRDRPRAVESLAIASAHDLARDHELVTAEHRALGDRIGEDVDELRHPVGVAAGGRGEQVRGDVAADGDVLGERFGAPDQDVGPAIDEALVLIEPRPPVRATRVVGDLDRPLAIRNRVRRIGDVGVVHRHPRLT